MCFRKAEVVTVYPADVVLFEGILMFYSQEIRDLFQMKLFVDTDADTRLSRRGEGGRPTVSENQRFALKYTIFIYIFLVSNKARGFGALEYHPFVSKSLM